MFQHYIQMEDKKAKLKPLGILLVLVLSLALVIAVPQFISVQEPTGTTEEKYIEIEYNITEANLKEVIFNWNGTNTTLFDDNVVLMYNFDNRSALGENDTLVYDLSKWGNNGSVVGGENITWSPTGKYGGAFNFSGNKSLINRSALNELNSSKNFTVVGWAYLKDQTDETIFANTLSSTNRVILQATSVLKAAYYNGSWTSDTANYNLNEWFFFSYKLENGIIDLKVNLEGISGSGTPGSSSVLGFSVGGLTSGGSSLNGSLDNIIVFNRSLSTSEIQQLYNSSLTKYNSTTWNLWTNNSMSHINTTGVTYPYYSCGIDTSDNVNCTTFNSITRLPESENVTGNYSSLIGIFNGGYGSVVGSKWLTNSNSNNIDTNDDGSYDAINNYTEHRQYYKNAKLGWIRSDTGHVTKYSNTTDQSGVNFTGNLSAEIEEVEWASENGLKVLLTFNRLPINEDGTSWLADDTYSCYSDNRTCAPLNYTKLANIAVDVINRTTSNGTYINDVMVEIWNEPYANFLLIDDSSLDNKSLVYNNIYNYTYDALKKAFPTLSIGGCSGYYGTNERGNFFNSFLSNFTTNMDFVSIHPYETSYKTNSINNQLNYLLGNCTSLGANCSLIIFSEFQPQEVELKNTSSRENEWASEIAIAYSESMNSNTSIIYFPYQWSSSYIYGPNYAEYPAKWHMFRESQMVSRELTPPYNVTKKFATYHPAGASVYRTSSTDTALKTVSTINSNDYALTIINTAPEPRNITVNLTGSKLAEIHNLETGAEYRVVDGLVNVGVMDSYEILYLGLLSTGLQTHFKLNENQGTTIYDISGNSNNGTISGATWNTDGILVVLTEATDYTLDKTTALFTNLYGAYEQLKVNTTSQWGVRFGFHTSIIKLVSGFCALVVLASALAFALNFLPDRNSK